MKHHTFKVNTLKKQKIVCLTFCLLYLVLNSSIVNGQTETVTVSLPLEKVKRIYELAFPTVSKDSFDSTLYEFAMDVRIDPSFQPPSQLSLLKLKDGRLVAFRYELKDSKTSLSEQLFTLLENGESDTPESLVKKLNVTKTEVKETASLVLLVNNFFKSINLENQKRALIVDGVGYEVVYIDSGSSINISIVGNKEYKKGESSFITWIRKTMNQRVN